MCASLIEGALVRFFVALLLLAAFTVKADYISTNQAVVEVAAVYPGDVLSADYMGDENGVYVRLLSPAGLVHKLVVCKQGSAVKIKEVTSENNGSGRSGCDTFATKN